MIPKIVNEETFSRDAASLLLNALYFKGAWANKFQKEYTRDEPFNGGAEVPMMSKNEELGYMDNGLYQALKLPYGNGAYQMTVILPHEGKTIGDVLDQMDGKNWQPVFSDYDVDLKLPRFKIETKLSLAQIMKDLGMPTAFSMDAEFPYFGNRGVFIDDMFQKAVIDLDEEGTTAAAITGIDVYTGRPEPATFYANRPFIYIISEQSTGVILFMGQYMGEGATGIKENVKIESLKNTSIYNLQGQRISVSSESSAPSVLPKGVYIVDGKKIFVK
jgi:serpin B